VGVGLANEGQLDISGWRNMVQLAPNYHHTWA